MQYGIDAMLPLGLRDLEAQTCSEELPGIADLGMKVCTVLLIFPGAPNTETKKVLWAVLGD